MSDLQSIQEYIECSISKRLDEKAQLSAKGSHTTSKKHAASHDPFF